MPAAALAEDRVDKADRTRRSSFRCDSTFPCLRFSRTMSADLIFPMGNCEARIPTDRGCSENHLWLKQGPVGLRVGFTSYSVRLLRDVYFLGWSVDPHTDVRKNTEIGEIESSKAISSLYAPFDGRILGFNENLLDDPSIINADNYGEGWLFDFESTAELITPEEYLQLLEAGWDDDQQLMKGQINW